MAATQLEETARALIQKDLELTESNDRLAKQLAEFQFLQEAGVIASSAKDRTGIERPIIVHLLMRLNYDRGFLLEINNIVKFLAFEGFEGLKPAALEQQISEHWRATLEHVQPTLVHKGDGSPLSELCGLFGVSSLALCPLKTANRTYGICGIGNEQPLNTLSQGDVDFLGLLTSQLSIAIENVITVDEMRRQNIELRQLDDAKTTFISIASHQLRTPLAVVQLAVSVLENPKAGTLSDQQKKTVSQIKMSNERLMGLVNDLLNLSRMEQGRIGYEPGQFLLLKLLQHIIKESDANLKEHKVTVTLAVDPALSFTADQNLMKEMLSNLVDNGIKYNKVGGSIAIKAVRDAQAVHLTVSDTGIGIGKDDLPEITNQFFRTEAAVRIDPNGTGLGLFITKNIVEMHGGEMTLASELGKGTTVNITMPLHPPSHVNSGLHLWTPKVRAPTGSGIHQWQSTKVRAQAV